MLPINWRRPSTSPHPQIWHRFERIKNGEKIQFKVQDVTEDLKESVFCLMKEYYMREETWSASTGVADDPVSLKINEDFTKENIFPQNVSLVCLLDNEDVSKTSEIIGCNLLGVSCSEDEKNFDQFKNLSDKLDKIINIFDTFKSYCPDVFAKYNVKKYLGAFGLCVHPNYRGLGIATEILKARVPLMKSIGISLTSTDFTSAASQKSAYKAGFKIDVSVAYKELSEKTGCEFKNCANCEMMSLKCE